MKRKKYTKDLKMQVIDLVVNENVEVLKVAKSLNISRIVIYRWIKEYNEFGEAVFTGNGNTRNKECAHVRKLEKENQRLKEELDILKSSRPSWTKTKSNLSIYSWKF